MMESALVIEYIRRASSKPTQSPFSMTATSTPEALDKVDDLIEVLDEPAFVRVYIARAAVGCEAIDARVNDVLHRGERVLLRRE